MDLIISLNKPKGITSQEAVTEVKRTLRAKKAGHTGTLDPIATGILIVCINRATRLSKYFTELDKQYDCIMKLGEVTDTQDAEGKIIATDNRDDITEQEIAEILQSFTGSIKQLPPMFSAKKYRGKPLYKLARRGKEVERDLKEVFIHKIDLIEYNYPFVRFAIQCSKGTYVRTLCHDIGQRLGIGGHLYKLTRTGIGPFKIEESITIEELKTIHSIKDLNRGIYTMDQALSWLPEVIAENEQKKSVLNGAPLMIDEYNELEDLSPVRVKSEDGNLLAIGIYESQKKMVKMDVVFT
jgi:tRNA pseudouridine55 synthase